MFLIVEYKVSLNGEMGGARRIENYSNEVMFSVDI